MEEEEEEEEEEEGKRKEEGKFKLLLIMYRYFVFSCSGDEEENPIQKAEDDFWHLLNQEKQDIEKREKKRQEAFLPKHQPTPIPEETGETPSTDEVFVIINIPL